MEWLSLAYYYRRQMTRMLREWLSLAHNYRRQMSSKLREWLSDDTRKKENVFELIICELIPA